MLIKHQGIPMDGGPAVTGYAVRVEDKTYIYLEDGSRIHVRRTSIQPCCDNCQCIKMIQQKLWNSEKHLLKDLNLGKAVINNLENIGINYVEDLEKWTEKDYKKIRGIGSVKQKIILEKLENIKTNKRR